MNKQAVIILSALIFSACGGEKKDDYSRNEITGFSVSPSSDSAVISGLVVDASSQKPIPASFHFKDRLRNFTQNTGADGRFLMKISPSTTYTLYITAPGYDTLGINGLNLMMQAANFKASLAKKGLSENYIQYEDSLLPVSQP